MSTTAQNLIIQSFVDIRAIVTGGLPSTGELNDALIRFNQHVASLNAEGAVLYEKRIETHALTSGVPSFTMGPSGADMNTDRPTRVLAARCALGSGYGRGLRVIHDPNDWTDLAERDVALTLPLVVYPDYQSDNTVLHFNPVPTVNAVLTIDVLELTGSFPDDIPAALATTLAGSMRRKTYTFNLTANTGIYNMGPGATLAAPRPAKVLSAGVSFSGYRHECRVIGSTAWEDLREADGQAMILPVAVYPVYGYPNATMNFWPAPGAGVTAEIHSLRQIGNFATLGTTVDLPVGFEEMLHQTFAVKLYEVYPRMEGMPPDLMQNASDAKAAVIAANIANGIVPPPSGGAIPGPPQPPPQAPPQQ